MTQRIVVVTFWALLIATTTWFAYHSGKHTLNVSPRLQGPEAELREDTSMRLPEGIGTDQDRYERFHWEMQRLANPTTGQIPDGIHARELKFASQLQVKKKSGNTGAQWQHRGPYNVGGRTRALALDVDDENTIVAGGVTGGMWRSTDGGQSFTKTTSPEQFHSVTCVTQDTRPGKHNIWYHGTGEYYAIISASTVQASGNGIYKSTDSGQSWTLLASTESNTPTTLYENGDFDFVWDIVVDQTDLLNDVVFAAVINGIYRSKDGGATWEAVLGADSTNGNLSEYTTVSITPSGVLYATLTGGAVDQGIWRSNDHGDTWTNITPFGWPNSTQRTVVGIVPQDENKLYFLTNTGGDNHELWFYQYLSGNGSGAGGYWDERTNNLPDQDCKVFYTFNFGPYKSQSGYDMCIAISPADSNLVLLGGTNIYRSEDGWKTANNYDWIGGYRCDYDTPSNYVYPNHHPDQHRMLFLPSNPDVLFSTNDGGMYKTTDILKDSVDWIPLNNGYTNSQFYTIAMEQGESNSNFLVGGMQDNGSYFTNNLHESTPWKGVFYGDGAYAEIPEGRGNYYLSWQGGKVFKFSIDDAGNVQGLTRIDPVGATGYLFIDPFILDPADGNTMYLTAGRYIWRNQALNAIVLDGDEYNPDTINWERIDISNTGSPFTGGSISALDISKADNNILYFGTSTGRVFRLDSLNNGTIVKTDLSNNGLGNGYVASVDVNEYDPNKVLVTYSNYSVPNIYYSTDGGASFTNVTGNLDENPDGSGNGPAVLWTEMIDLTDSTIYFAGTSVGLFSTTLLDGANTVWTQEGTTSIGDVVINMIKTRSYDGKVVVATHGQGVYSTRYKDYVGIKPQPEATVQSFDVMPNPFSQRTNISFELERSEKMSLEVFALDGRLVRTIFTGTLPAGAQQFSWDAADQNGSILSNGAYIIQLTGERYNSTKKVILAR